MEALLQDIRFGLHQLLRKPRLAALGIGANTSIVSLLDTVLFPLPVHEPARLVQLFGTVNKGADVTLSSYLNYKHYRDRNRHLRPLRGCLRRQQPQSRRGETTLRGKISPAY